MHEDQGWQPYGSPRRSAPARRLRARRLRARPGSLKGESAKGREPKCKSPGGQACKKAQEASRMAAAGERERAKAELLGAINYLAGAVIVLEEIGS